VLELVVVDDVAAAGDAVAAADDVAAAGDAAAAVAGAAAAVDAAVEVTYDAQVPAEAEHEVAEEDTFVDVAAAVHEGQEVPQLEQEQVVALEHIDDDEGWLEYVAVVVVRNTHWQLVRGRCSDAAVAAGDDAGRLGRG